MAKTTVVPWTREHLLVALNLYHKLPFGQFDQGNALIADVARRLGRSASSLAMKLSNLASLDSVQRARGIRGLTGASRNDRTMWDAFHEDHGELAAESEQILHDLFTKDADEELDFLDRGRVRIERPRRLKEFDGPTERSAVVRQRRGQQYFRQVVLNAYGVRCCISGIDVPRMLVASHIRPWHKFPNDRLNPSNGLCLSSLHDAAFDSGLITLDEQKRVVLSRRLRDHFPQPALEFNFAQFEGQPIRPTEKVCEPDESFLAFHRTEVFAG